MVWYGMVRYGKVRYGTGCMYVCMYFFPKVAPFLVNEGLFGRAAAASALVTRVKS